VQKFCPLGIYVLPTDNFLSILIIKIVWSGYIVINDGIYKGGYFKFDVLIPSSYPINPPQVVFKNKVYHPLVDMNTGSLDIEKKFNNWTPGKNLIVNILFYIKDIFFNPTYLQEKTSLNPICSRAFTDNRRIFNEELNVTSTQSREDNLQKTKSNINTRMLLDKIKTTNSDSNLAPSDKLIDLTRWFMNSYLEIIKNDS
jgi:ubiquitin-protein ligase